MAVADTASAAAQTAAAATAGQRRMDRSANAGRPAGFAGVWDYRTATPLERPAEFAGKEFLTDQEIADYEARRRATTAVRRTIPAAIRPFTRPGGWTTAAAWSGRGAHRSLSNRPMDEFHR